MKKQDCQDKPARTGQPAEDGQERISKGQAEHDS